MDKKFDEFEISRYKIFFARTFNGKHIFPGDINYNESYIIDNNV